MCIQHTTVVHTDCSGTKQRRRDHDNEDAYETKHKTNERWQKQDEGKNHTKCADSSVCWSVDVCVEMKQQQTVSSKQQ